MTISIKINPSFYREVRDIANRTQRLRKEAESKVGARGDIIRALSHGYFTMVRDNLLSGKYPKSTKSYNKDYLNWKIRNYGHAEPWFLAGDLFRNIQIYEKDGGRAVGIPKGKKVGGKSWLYEKGDQSKGYNARDISYYAYLNEYGSPSGKIPARPVFTPTLADFVRTEVDDILKKSSHGMFKRWEIR
jgi:hypothetical protein